MYILKEKTNCLPVQGQEGLFLLGHLANFLHSYNLDVAEGSTKEKQKKNGTEICIFCFGTKFIA